MTTTTRASVMLRWRRLILSLCLVPAVFGVILANTAMPEQSGPHCDAGGENYCCSCNSTGACGQVQASAKFSCTSEFCSPNSCKFRP